MSSLRDDASPAKRTRSEFTASDYLEQLDGSPGLAARDTYIVLRPGPNWVAPGTANSADVAELQRLVSDPAFLAKHKLLSCTVVRDEETGGIAACMRYEDGVECASAARELEACIEDLFDTVEEEIAKKVRFGVQLQVLRFEDVAAAVPRYAPDYSVKGFYAARRDQEFVLFEPKGDAKP